jgi:FtsZ-interacting cell division protein ZipA
VHREQMAAHQTSLQNMFEQMMAVQQEHSTKVFDHLHDAEQRCAKEREADKQAVAQVQQELQQVALASLNKVAAQVLSSHGKQEEERSRRRAALRLLLDEEE